MFILRNFMLKINQFKHKIMKIRIKLSTLEEMIRMKFDDNKMAFAAVLKQHGMHCSEKTIIRALEGKSDKDENVEPYISEKISLPVLISLCEEYDFYLWRCFTFYNEHGIEKTPASASIGKMRTKEPIRTNLLRMAYDICCLYPRLPMIKTDMGLDLDFMDLANEEVDALSHYPATELVEKLMAKHLDVNKYIRQGDFKLPYQNESTFAMAAEDILPSNEQEYLSAYLGLRLAIQDVNKNFDEKMKLIRQRGHELIEQNGNLVESIYQLLLLITKELRPFPENYFFRRPITHYHIDEMNVHGNLNNMNSEVNINTNIEK